MYLLLPLADVLVGGFHIDALYKLSKGVGMSSLRVVYFFL